MLFFIDFPNIFNYSKFRKTRVFYSFSTLNFPPLLLRNYKTSLVVSSDK